MAAELVSAWSEAGVTVLAVIAASFAAVAAWRTEQPKPIEILPPGVFFIESKRRQTGEYYWALPQLVSEPSSYEPLTRSTKHGIAGIRYHDKTLATTWMWRPASGLTKA